jgi:hypothetical protein
MSTTVPSPVQPLLVLRVIARMNIGGPAHHVSILSSRLPGDRYRTLLVSGRVGSGEEELLTAVEPLRLDRLGPELDPRADAATIWQLARGWCAGAGRISSTRTPRRRGSSEGWRRASP